MKREALVDVKAPCGGHGNDHGVREEKDGVLEAGAAGHDRALAGVEVALVREGGDADDDVAELGQGRVLGDGDAGDAAAEVAGLSRHVEDAGGGTGARGTNQQVALVERRRRGVPHHVARVPHVHEPHGHAPHHEQRPSRGAAVHVRRLIDEGDELLEPLPAHALEDAGQLTRSQRGDLVDRHLR